MAYLKGNSYVDGDLYINGGLKVKRLIDPNGLNFPYLYDENSSQENHLIKFATDDGALTSSRIIEEILDNELTYTIDGDEVTINVNSNNIYLEGATSIDINTLVSQINGIYSDLIYLKQISSLDDIGNGQEYYYDGTFYYIPFEGEPGPYNWPDGICYKEVLEIK